MLTFSATESQEWKYDGKNNHSTLVMSKLEKFDLIFLKVEWSIGCLEPRSFWRNAMSKCMPSKMIFFHHQIYRIQLFNIQIMKNFVIHFDRNCFVLILSWIAATLARSQWDCWKFFLAVWLAFFEFWREGKTMPLDPISFKNCRKCQNLLNKYRNAKIYVPEAD